MKKIIYISGKITGDPHYKAKFRRAERYLKKQGYIVINPAYMPAGLTFDQYMSVDKKMIDVADKIYFLKDWVFSRGAIEERKHAGSNKDAICQGVNYAWMFFVNKILSAYARKTMIKIIGKQERENQLKKIEEEIKEYNSENIFCYYSNMELFFLLFTRKWLFNKSYPASIKNTKQAECADVFIAQCGLPDEDRENLKYIHPLWCPTLESFFHILLKLKYNKIRGDIKVL